MPGKEADEMNRLQIIQATVHAILCICAAAVTAAEYPVRPIRMIVPFIAGGNADLTARVVSQKLSERLGQQIVVENQGGAGGIIGEGRAAKATPDGYTIVLVSIAHAVNPALYKKLPYDTQRDFAPITMATSVPNLLIVHAQLPAKTVPELIALAKAKPGSLSYGGTGKGASPQLAGELFTSMAGVDIVQIGYRGSADASRDLFSGQIHLMFAALPTGLASSRSGQVRALGVTSAKRSPVAPEIPAISEFVPGYEMVGWTGFLAPRGTPESVIALLNKHIAAILKSPDVRERFSAMGLEPVGNSPVDFNGFIKSEINKWARLMRDSGIQRE